MKPKDYTGCKFGWLVVLRRGSDKRFKTSKHVQWECRCVCGAHTTMRADRLRRLEPNLSCGCKRFTGFHGNSKHDPKSASFIGLFNRMRNSARRRRLPWNLSLHHFKRLVTSRCNWCETAPAERFNAVVSKNRRMQRKHATRYVRDGWIKYNGLDRVNNDRGYFRRNVKPSCKYCNFARNERTVQEFKSWIKRIAIAQGMTCAS